MKKQNPISSAAGAGVLVLTLASLAGAQDRPLFQGPSVVNALPVEALIAQGPVPQTGAVLITEFMKDPNFVTDTKGEWIEVYNNLPWRVNLEGWTISDDSGSLHVINNGGLGLRMAPGQYFVLGNNADPAQNGGVTLNYAYTGFILGNGADQIVLTRPNGLVVDRVAYDDGVIWPDSAGRSISLKLSARDVYANDDGANWCHSVSHWNAANPDTGTPGQDNDACP